MKLNSIENMEKKQYVAPEVFIVEFETEEGFAVSITNDLDIDLHGFGEMTTAGGSERGEWDGDITGEGWD